jgi:hypothetical protein
MIDPTNGGEVAALGSRSGPNALVSRTARLPVSWSDQGLDAGEGFHPGELARLHAAAITGYVYVRYELTRADYDQVCGQICQCWLGLNVSGSWQ